MEKKFEIDIYSPCRDSRIFREQYKTFEEAWKNCPRGDWMLWLAKRIGVDKRTLTLAKAHCALTVKHLMKDERSLKACEIAIKYGNGEATEQELKAVANAAYAAYAADAAADADADAAVADAAVADYARTDNRKQTADICRKYLTDEILALINKQ